MGLEAGAVDYIAKPINPPIVRARVSTHLALKLQRDYLQILVRQDALTSLINRRGLDELLSREWRRAARARKPLSLLMLDIDSFKAYNDSYGHMAGDQCLQQVSSCLGSVLHRGGDYLVRYGGEEFAVLLTDTPFEFLQLLGERLRTAVEDMMIPHANSIVKNVVTISIGGASVVPVHTDKPEALMLEADRMLYKVKNGGRNGVQVSDLGGPTEAPPLTASAAP
jgi:diguanylate cyclase (GGDEF)-like protein